MTMSTEQPTVDARAVEETKRQIRSLVNEIAAIARKDLEPGAFYAEFLQLVITALAANGGAVWTVRKDGGLELAYQVNYRQAFPESIEEDQKRHARLLHSVLRGGEQRLVPPYSGTEGDEESGNPTGFLLVLSPVHSGEEPAGVVEIFQRPTAGPQSQRGYLRFLAEMCQHVGDYLNSRKLSELSDWQNLFSRVDRFSRSVHESLDPRTTAYTIANEGRRLIGCDRVSVALNKGRRCRVEAVSGQDIMDTRSNAVMLLSKLATAVVRSGEPLWFTGDSSDLPPQIETAVHDYVDETHTKTVAVLPLFRPSDYVPDGDEVKRMKEEKEECVGALIVEQIEDSREHQEFARGIELVSEHSSRALSNAVEHNNLFLMPLWRSIGRATWVLKARTLPKTLLVASVVVAIIAAFFLVPWDFEMKAPGKLQPKDRKEVFADIEGDVIELADDLKHGSLVRKGQKLLTLQNNQVRSEWERVNGELRTAVNRRIFVKHERSNPELQDNERFQLEQEYAELEDKIQTIQSEQKYWQEQVEKLVIRSPCDGRILNFQLRRTLEGRPLNRGDNVMTIADLNSEWILDVNMPEDQMGHVIAYPLPPGEDYKVTYILKAHPDKQLVGTLARNDISDAAQLDEVDGNSVRMLVELNEEDLVDEKGQSIARPGNEATAKVYCGRKCVGYVLFHKLVEFAQSRFFF